MNFTKKIMNVGDKFVFYELCEDKVIALLKFDKGFNLPLSKSVISKGEGDNININIRLTLMNIAYIVALEPQTNLAITYLKFLKKIHHEDEMLLKTLVDDLSEKSDDEVLASVYGLAVACEDIYYYNILAKIFIKKYVATEDKNHLLDALELFEDSIDIIDNAEAYYYISFIKSELEDYEAAYDFAKKALEFNPADNIRKALEDGMDIIRDRNDIQTAARLIHLTEFEEALELLENTTEKTDDLWEKHMYYGEVYAVLDDLDKSIKHLKKALELNPTNPDIYSSLGLVSVMVGDYLKAREIFEAGIKLQPLNTDLLKNLALLYTRISKQELAKELIEHVIKIDPEDAEAKSILEEIEEKLSEN